ncbi:uncharacterized protein K452DRAFT_170534 [Aplosporella prunicola CBS 121167]|uniref:Uncharacterized protein n=1 Tax=Aplosporella prunicola CBS 121167 TaxID=1176127 RepID=A0A6A6BGZ2_9PEZI|nr:uncharacterized protein K452DRAFT_170534 [Aplosporella prunicola CBS 121167]KAF2143400.1 hypothetical protein K452DRAFT_170534 [Aplosporella prunicola CBS 121167]
MAPTRLSKKREGADKIICLQYVRAHFPRYPRRAVFALRIGCSAVLRPASAAYVLYMGVCDFLLTCRVEIAMFTQILTGLLASVFRAGVRYKTQKLLIWKTTTRRIMSRSTHRRNGMPRG